MTYTSLAMRRVYHGKKIFFVVFVSILITLTTMEIVLARWFPQRTLGYLKQTHLSCYQKSERLPYEFRPNCRGQFLTAFGVVSPVRINNIGFRGPDIGKKSGKRILFLGDSYVFGYGVDEEDSMPSRLSKELGVDVINAGIWAAGPDFEYLIADRVEEELQPDLIILGIFPENDLRDLTETAWTMGDNGTLWSVKNDKFVDDEGFLWRDAVSRRFYIPIVRNSHVVAFLSDRVSGFITRLRTWLTGWNPPKDPKLSFLGPYEQRLDIQWDYSCLFESRCEGPLEDARQKAVFIFDRFKELSDREHIPLAIVMIPFRPQMSGEEPLETLFHRLSEERNIPVIDLAGPLKESGLSLDEIYQKDDHFSPQGNDLSARAIAGNLRDRKIFLSYQEEKR